MEIAVDRSFNWSKFIREAMMDHFNERAAAAEARMREDRSRGLVGARIAAEFARSVLYERRRWGDKCNRMAHSPRVLVEGEEGRLEFLLIAQA